MVRRAANGVRAVLALLGPLGAGSRVLMLRLLVRFGWVPVAAGVGVVAYSVNRYRTWIVWILLAWCVAAWMHAPDPGPQAAEEQLDEAGEEPTAHPIPGLLWDLMGDAPGVHLKTLTERLQVAAPGMALNRAVVRTELAALGIPVRASVRDAAGRVNEGVHRDDLTAWEATATPTAETTPKARSKPVATALTSDVANTATGVATPPTPAE